MAAPLEAKQLKSLRVLHGRDACNLLLYDGADSPSLVHAVSARFKLGHAAFHLTREDMEDVVPLTSALPNGLTVVLHVQDRPMAWSEPLTGTTAAGHPSATVQRRARLDLPPCMPSDAPVAPYQTKGPRQDDASTAQKNDAPANANALPASGPSSDMHFTFSAPLLGDSASPSAARDDVQMTGSQMPGPFLSSPSPSVLDCHQASAHSASALQHLEDAANILDRYSRLSTELANERTLLAWIRTSLAALRTTFSYFGIYANQEGWRATIIAAQVAMMASVVFASISGTQRYTRIKDILRLPEIPQDFGRISIQWFNAMLVMIFLCTTVGIVSRAWTDG